MNAPPYTVTKLVAWRVKDLVSCFNACKLPREEERETKTKNPATTGMARETAIVESKVRNSYQKAKKEEESPSKVTKRKEIGDVSSRWPSFANDQDYIVFCFGDDGEVHVLPEKNSSVDETSSSSTNPRRLSLQLLRLEDEAARKEKESTEQVKGKEAAICSSNEIEEVNIEEEESGGEGKDISSDSNDQSDAASSSSFAFPIIQGGWIGSPVQMPKPTRTQRPKNNRIHCCRF